MVNPYAVPQRPDLSMADAALKTARGDATRAAQVEARSARLATALTLDVDDLNAALAAGGDAAALQDWAKALEQRAGLVFAAAERTEQLGTQIQELSVPYLQSPETQNSGNALRAEAVGILDVAVRMRQIGRAMAADLARLDPALRANP